MPDFVVTLHTHDNLAKGVRRAARMRIVAQAILRAQLTVNAVEDGVELLRGIGIKNGAAGRVRDGLEGVFPGSVAAALALHRADDDGVEKRTRENGLPSGRFEIAARGGFAGVGDQDDDPAVLAGAAVESAGAK